ncbi:MAG: hypothetical protein R2911_15690 [Caldilineaceae bacterium]
MVVTVDAVFDGRVFLPVQPIRLPANTRVQIAVTTDERSPISFLDVAEALALEGPPDWSLQLDEYLYGGRQLDGQ